MRSGNRFEWRVLVKPIGIIDGNLIAQIKLTDSKIVTAEREEREAREQAEATRQAEAESARQRRERNKPVVAAECIAKTKDAVGCFSLSRSHTDFWLANSMFNWQSSAVRAIFQIAPLVMITR